jgi:hypothetical protein
VEIDTSTWPSVRAKASFVFRLDHGLHPFKSSAHPRSITTKSSPEHYTSSYNEILLKSCQNARQLSDTQYGTLSKISQNLINSPRILFVISCILEEAKEVQIKDESCCRCEMEGFGKQDV